MSERKDNILQDDLKLDTTEIDLDFVESDEPEKEESPESLESLESEEAEEAEEAEAEEVKEPPKKPEKHVKVTTPEKSEKSEKSKKPVKDTASQDNELDSEISDLINKTKKGSADWYNHRRNKSQKERDAALLKKYADVGIEPEDTSLLDHKLNRRELADKLETDPVFRKKWMAAEERRRAAKKEEETLNEVLEDIHAGAMRETEELPEPDDDGDGALPGTSKAQNCVYIGRVDNLTINFHF